MSEKLLANRPPDKGSVKWKVARSAVTGRFVTREEAAANPAETVIETYHSRPFVRASTQKPPR